MTGRAAGADEPADLAIIVVSTNEANWLEPCLRTVFEHAGDARLDVVVVDNESTDGTRELVETRFPEARVVSSVNRGFAHANNRGAMTCSARYVLFLNPDTEVVEGTFGELVSAMDERPLTGLAGVRQVTADGALTPTIRYFPSVVRTLSEAFFSERWPVRPRWAGERELDLAVYGREAECDWTSGSFMLARREALLSAGLLDERFFIYSEEPDLCLRMKRHGWSIRHLPTMTVIHHAGKGGVRPKMAAQGVFTRRQYARKHFAAPRRVAFLTTVGIFHALRAVAPRRGTGGAERRTASRLALRTLVGRADPPFGQPPGTALPPG
jgi:N-acetylglucosaminyl-diphospho-decaprenol L-rhamnosyltransferase